MMDFLQSCLIFKKWYSGRLDTEYRRLFSSSQNFQPATEGAKMSSDDVKLDIDLSASDQALAEKFQEIIRDPKRFVRNKKLLDLIVKNEENAKRIASDSAQVTMAQFKRIRNPVIRRAIAAEFGIEVTKTPHTGFRVPRRAALVAVGAAVTTLVFRFWPRSLNS
jgi:hypothetical protein